MIFNATISVHLGRLLKPGSNEVIRFFTRNIGTPCQPVPHPRDDSGMDLEQYRTLLMGEMIAIRHRGRCNNENQESRYCIGKGLAEVMPCHRITRLWLKVMTVV